MKKYVKKQIFIPKNCPKGGKSQGYKCQILSNNEFHTLKDLYQIIVEI